MLMGNYKNSIDAKCRMIVPSKLREELGYRCVLTRGMDECLYIYPMDTWESLRQKLSALPTTDPGARRLVRHFYADAVECEIDKQGRIVIPQELREYAHIEKDLVTVGLNDKIEIWSRKLWEEVEESALMDPADFAKAMVQYGI